MPPAPQSGWESQGVEVENLKKCDKEDSSINSAQLDQSKNMIQMWRVTQQVPGWHDLALMPPVASTLL